MRLSELFFSSKHRPKQDRELGENPYAKLTKDFKASTPRDLQSQPEEHYMPNKFSVTVSGEEYIINKEEEIEHGGDRSYTNFYITPPGGKKMRVPGEVEKMLGKIYNQAQLEKTISKWIMGSNI